MQNIPRFLWAIVAVQTLCAGFFVFDLGISLLGLRTTATSWQMREILEISASLGLILGAVLGLRSVLAARRRALQADRALRSAAGDFAVVVEERFVEWSLTPAERDVAWYAIKGFNTAEMAGLRGSSEGTIKAQCNAIYRKADVSSRTQLLAVLVEELLLDT
ncbi:MAG: helix-turn-helix transcriptional regulator [Rhodobacteraceae bacterium]|nr:helix-turn-helix transcriptional regulator [Paracoccaceae bacterium]